MIRTLWALALIAGCAGNAPAPQTPTSNAPAPRTVVSLRLSDLSGDSPPPRSRLELVLVHDHAELEIALVGEIVGICTPEVQAPRGLLAKIRCWWEGEEMTYSARRVGDTVQVRRGEEVLLEAPIPADVETHSL